MTCMGDHESISSIRDEENTYGCACVGYGQGGDGAWDDVNCFCAIGGIGEDRNIY